MKKVEINIKKALDIDKNYELFEKKKLKKLPEYGALKVKL